MQSAATLSSTGPRPTEEAPILRKPGHEDPLTNPGVSVSEVIAQRLNKGSIWTLCIILGAVIYINSLREMTMVWSAHFDTPWGGGRRDTTVSKIQYGDHAMRALGILFFSRLADISSRPTSSTVALSLFVLGSIIASAAPNSPAFAAGLIIQTIASAGLGLLITLFIADYTILKWRGLALSSTYFPYIINMWVAPRIFENVNWRWICGMFAILFTALCSPALVMLYSAAASYKVAPSRTSWTQKVKYGLARMDLIGLVLFVAGCGLIEYGLGRSSWWDIGMNLADEWAHSRLRPSACAKSDVLAVGRSVQNGLLATGLVLLLPAFFLWEVLYAPFPLMPKRVLTNRAVACGILVNFFGYMSQMTPQGALVHFVNINSPPWNLGTIGYILSSSSMAYSVFAPIAGVVFLMTRRYKSHLLLGNGVFILGTGLMVHCARVAYPQESYPPISLVIVAQVLIGIGSITTELGVAVGSQASVSHDDLATVITLMNAWSLVAIDFSNPIANAILSQEPISEHAKFVILFALGLGLSFFTFTLSLLMPNFVLGATHNLVEEKGVSGEHASGGNDLSGNA